MMTLGIFFALVGVASLGFVTGYTTAVRARHLIEDTFADVPTVRVPR